MSEPVIASLHNFSGRFLRSTDLVRDFDDPHGLDGYWLTNFSRSCLGRISDGFRQDSATRSWRLTGDFGSGKSSFALLLAHTSSDAQNRLPKSILHQVVSEIPSVTTLRYAPVLVTATRERMAPAILRAVYKVFGSLYSRRGIRSDLEIEISTLLAKPDQIEDSQVLSLIEKTNRKIIQNGRSNGMLLILDEVGKFLEFAAHNRDAQDVYFLQRLSEIANRSGKEPLIVVCLLHQGFNAYAEQLAPSSQREWEKVAGRFEEIVFRQPLDQVALLIASALKLNEERLPKQLQKQAAAVFDAGVKLGWFGTSASREVLGSLTHKLFPIDPLLLPVLVRMFQRFGQNERSLFSFLCSYEPFGLRAFSNNSLDKTSSPYRIADFYDYIRANFGHRLGVASYRTHWGVIESKIDIHPADKYLELRILKTVGVLNLLNVDDVRPTRDALCWAVAGESEEGRQDVARLLKKLEGRDLHFRGETRGYSLWPYTSVDIDARLNEAKIVIPEVTKVADAIRKQLDSRPIVARSHYIETGNLRYFNIIYCEPSDLVEKALEQISTHGDGIVVVPLCETRHETEVALQTARELKGRKDLIQLVAVPRPLNHLHQAALDALRWEWVQVNTPELNNDAYARDEVELHLQEARNRLQSQIQEFIGLHRIGGRNTLSWFYCGIDKQLPTGRKVMRWLSELCNDVYRSAPKIRNELVNRHTLSSAAVAARMRLIERMFSCAHKPDLGMPPDRKPPEKSMYFSVLRAAGLHRVVAGQWKIGYPDVDTNMCVLPALRKIHKIISDRPDVRVPLNELMSVLRQPPFGVRGGLFPIFLATVAIANRQEIAFYENGTFLREVGRDEFLRMTKAPEKFDVQYCRIDGMRSTLFMRLAQVLELSSSDREVVVLDVVSRLCHFVANLPEYSRSTKRVSQTAIAIREVILEAREPIHMVFHDLPIACGHQKFDTEMAVSVKTADTFVQQVKTAMDELEMSLLGLKHRMADNIAVAFGYEGQSLQECRPKLAKRAEILMMQVTESKLKGFAFRLFDNLQPDLEWLESVGSFVSLRPPSRWRDEDEDVFNQELETLISRFRRTEAIEFNGTDGALRLRVTVTKPDGSERQEVIHFEPDEEDVLRKTELEISVLIARNKRLGVAAATRAIWEQLKTEGTN